MAFNYIELEKVPLHYHQLFDDNIITIGHIIRTDLPIEEKINTNRPG